MQVKSQNQCVVPRRCLRNETSSCMGGETRKKPSAFPICRHFQLFLASGLGIIKHLSKERLSSKRRRKSALQLRDRYPAAPKNCLQAYSFNRNTPRQAAWGSRPFGEDLWNLPDKQLCRKGIPSKLMSKGVNTWALKAGREDRRQTLCWVLESGGQCSPTSHTPY